MSRLLLPLSAGLLVPALFAALWAAPPAAPAPQAPDYAREFQSINAVCARCHNLQMVDTPRSYDAWHDTVQRMIDLGANGTDDQLDDIMDYLHHTMTTINVNTADPNELQIVLDIPEKTANAIVARRATKKFTSLSDLKSIPGIHASTIDAKASMIFFH
jgi:helix-hairpin-helix protein